jgi:hypothetical protein
VPAILTASPGELAPRLDSQLVSIEEPISVSGWSSEAGEEAHFIVRDWVLDGQRLWFDTACGTRHMRPRYRPLTGSPTGRLCPECLRRNPVRGRRLPPPSSRNAKQATVRVAETEPAASDAVLSSDRGTWWRGLLTALASSGISAVTFVVVFLVAMPLAWIGLGVAASVAYLGDPLMEGFWFGPLGIVAHAGGAVLLAAIAAAVAAGAVRSTVGRSR